MVVARSLSETTQFDHSGTQFFLRPLPHRIMLRLSTLEASDQVELLLRAGIGGWNNFLSGDGIVECKLEDDIVCGVSVPKALTIASFDAIPFNLIGELSAQILRVNQLSADDAGN